MSRLGLPAMTEAHGISWHQLVKPASPWQRGAVSMGRPERTEQSTLISEKAPEKLLAREP
jgi:hypothetical protein